MVKEKEARENGNEGRIKEKVKKKSDEIRKETKGNWKEKVSDERGMEEKEREGMGTRKTLGREEG